MVQPALSERDERRSMIGRECCCLVNDVNMCDGQSRWIEALVSKYEPGDEGTN